MIISFISTRSFKEKRTIHSKSEAVGVYMGNNSKNVIDTLFNTLLKNFQRAQETSNERGSEFIPDKVELLDYNFHAIDIRRAESYIMSIIAGLNYNNIKEKELKKNRVKIGLIQIFHHTKETGEN